MRKKKRRRDEGEKEWIGKRDIKKGRESETVF